MNFISYESCLTTKPSEFQFQFPSLNNAFVWRNLMLISISHGFISFLGTIFIRKNAWAFLDCLVIILILEFCVNPLSSCLFVRSFGELVHAHASSRTSAYYNFHSFETNQAGLKFAPSHYSRLLTVNKERKNYSFPYPTDRCQLLN